ncbi:MAG TPA: hypothetical protein VE988_08265 [Gemmataceae bacterium]|nr:hypothetical protein [Gemmataceae bacterium]
MNKAAARAIIDGMAIPPAQSQAARRTIVRATASEEIDIVAVKNGDILITRQRAGNVGKQVFEDTISPDGTKIVVQKAYDDAGNLVHYDPKGGTP